jgi:cytochrome b561/polyisoprenoid-binding protein YceI
MQRYSRIAIALHWAIAAALAFQIALGWGLEGLGARGFSAFQLHKSVGITILVLTLARIAVRYWKPRPAPKEGGINGALAKGVHIGLYVFMLGAPLTGWALVSTAKVKVPTLIFGTIPLPHLPLAQANHALYENAHGLLAWLGVALFLLHVAGALRHHVLLRDGLIYRMVPTRSMAIMLGLVALVPLGLVLGKAALPGKETLPKPVASVPAEAGADNAIEAAANASAVAVIDNAAATPANAAEASKEDIAPVGPPPLWKMQKGGNLAFSVGSSDGSTIAGHFNSWSARIVMDPDHPETADIGVDINLASATVGDPTQDGMLPGAEFFDVAAHPTARFTARGAESTEPGSYRDRKSTRLNSSHRYISRMPSSA